VLLYVPSSTPPGAGTASPWPQFTASGAEEPLLADIWQVEAAGHEEAAQGVRVEGYPTLLWVEGKKVRQSGRRDQVAELHTVPYTVFQYYTVC